MQYELSIRQSLLSSVSSMSQLTKELSLANNEKKKLEVTLAHVRKELEIEMDERRALQMAYDNLVRALRMAYESTVWGLQRAHDSP